MSRWHNDSAAAKTRSLPWEICSMLERNYCRVSNTDWTANG